MSHNYKSSISPLSVAVKRRESHSLLGNVVIDFGAKASQSASAAALQGTLQCCLFGAVIKQKNVQNIPRKLILERIVATRKLKNVDLTASSSCFRLSPIKSTNAAAAVVATTATLDLSTLNVLLLSMKSYMWLKEAADSDNGRRFLFVPRSNTTAHLVEESELRKKPTTTNEKQNARKLLTDASAAVSTGKPELTTTSKSASAWRSMVPKTPPEDNCLEDVYSACLERGDPTTVALATQIIPYRLLKVQKDACLDNLPVNDSTILLFRKLVRSMDEIVTQNQENRRREVEVQILMRLVFLAMYGDDFLRWYARELLILDKKRIKKHSKPGSASSPRDHLLDHVTTMLSSVAFWLPATTTLSRCLKDLVPFDLYRSIPEFMTDIYEFFEVPDPFLQQGDSNDDDPMDVDDGPIVLVPEASCSATLKQEHEVSSMPPPPIASVEPKQQSPTTAATSLSVGFVDENDAWMRQSVALTTQKPTSNPLLSKRRKQYVASHFNSNLSNIGSLFREAPRGVAKASNGSNGASRPLKKSSKNHLPMTSAARRRGRHGIVSETPLKRPLQSVLLPSSRLVSETPCKTTSTAAAFRGRKKSITFAPSPMSTPDHNESQSSLHFVAEAALAVKRKR